MPVNAHCHIHSFRSMLVAHIDAVLSRIIHVDVVDSDRAALWLLSDGKMSLVNNLPVITKPEDLWGWIAVDEARQAKRLALHDGDNIRKTLCHFGPLSLSNGQLPEGCKQRVKSI